MGYKTMLSAKNLFDQITQCHACRICPEPIPGFMSENIALSSKLESNLPCLGLLKLQIFKRDKLSILLNLSKIVPNNAELFVGKELPGMIDMSRAELVIEGRTQEHTVRSHDSMNFFYKSILLLNGNVFYRLE